MRALKYNKARCVTLVTIEDMARFMNITRANLERELQELGNR
jgi:hypothetical protein